MPEYLLISSIASDIFLTVRYGLFVIMASKTSVALEKGSFDAIIFCCAVDMPTLQQFGHYVHKSGVVVAPVDFGSGLHYLTKYVPDMNFALVLASMPRRFLTYEDEFRSFEPQTDAIPV